MVSSQRKKWMLNLQCLFYFQFMTYVKMVKCIRISVIDIGVKSPKAGIAHPSGVPKFILGFSGGV
jgi:hypothetical protein